MWVAVISRWLIKADGVILSVNSKPFFLSYPTINLPGKHVTGFFDFVTRNMMFDIWFVYPCLDVDDLLPVVVWHGRTVNLVWEGTRKVRRSSFHQGRNCVTLMQDGTCVILFFVSNTEHRLHPAVGFTHAVTAAHVSADRKQKDAKY